MAENNQKINMREVIQKAVKNNSTGLTDKEVKLQEEAMIKIFEEGIFPADALGFNQEFLEYVYKFAYALYQQNKVEEASQLYRWLHIMEPVNPKYMVALTHCLIQQKDWLTAVFYLTELSYFNPKDPMPFVKMSECLQEANDLPGAFIAIDQAIKNAGDKKEYAEEKEKWLMNYDYILSQVDIDPAAKEKMRTERLGNKSLNATKAEE
jgi:tetratricopeptide (TPR) repeat protein